MQFQFVFFSIIHKDRLSVKAYRKKAVELTRILHEGYEISGLISALSLLRQPVRKVAASAAKNSVLLIFIKKTFDNDSNNSYILDEAILIGKLQRQDFLAREVRRKS